ncbi:IS66 family transposase [Reyranella sp.]|uniref:IS66 family transposase n=1 Tax=Reyranella sp. TaxID=1929291 RepID=UPI003D132820
MSPEITAAAFAAHLQCPTKGWLVRAGEIPTNAFWSSIRASVAEAYKAKAAVGRVALLTGTASTIDAESTMWDTNKPMHPHQRRGAASPDSCPQVIPILYSPWERLDKSGELLVAFAALALYQGPRCPMPTAGCIVNGEHFRLKRVDIVPQLSKAQEVLDVMVALAESPAPPGPVLNEHCPAREYQSRCRGIAIERDDLSLLTAITPKERTKFRAKGVTTITQLSYGYRPRRRRRPKSTPRRTELQTRHDHKLKAFALKKGKIHVVGTPLVPSDGHPVFIDVEGAPDRNFYYLVGLRHHSSGEPVHWSFWADRAEDEGQMWRQCLGRLRQVENPQLFHYGAYESRFLRKMRERWPPDDADTEFVDRLIERAVNILAIMYGRVYFPTHTNGLKEVSRWLGFEWHWPHSSGRAAIFARRYWELTSDDKLKQELIIYNGDDCHAAEIVADALVRLSGDNKERGLDPIQVGSLEVPFQRTFGKLQCALPEFEKINAAAYWNYQRSRVYIRTDKTIAKSTRRKRLASPATSANKETTVDDKPETCPKCGSTKVWSFGEMARTIYDLKFIKGGIKRWMIRYRYRRHRCGNCRAEMTIFYRKTKFGPNLRAYVVYLVIELRLSNQKISEHLAQVLGVAVLASAVHEMKSEAARLYEPTYRSILREIASGPLVHADETKGVVYGGGHYVWIFTNLTSVAYVYSPSREAVVLEDVLAGFEGVLVSDFYGGYDAVPCRQQKCLIHLMRDINEELLKQPFDEELASIAREFGSLLREIVETVDRWGLKRHHLGKHRRAVERFFGKVAAMPCSTESATALQKRIGKNREKLFTFLHCDSIPWNNNNAEHAVRAFTRLRNTMASSTAKGTADYCILLSVQQTLRYRGIDFLDFLRSGKTEIDA